MKSIFLGIISIFCQLNIILSQPDTLALKEQVNKIFTEKNHADFWDFIYERDQNMMQSDRIEEINIENLVLVSYYLNKFGYPDIQVLGDKAKIINMVWVHNKYDEIKKMTYPIILQGYLKKAISEFNLREYFLRILYQNYHDDHGHMSKPLSEIYKELEPNLSNSIDIQKMLAYYLEREKYFEQEKLSLGTWKSEDVIYSGSLNENPYSRTLPGNQATIYKMPDEKYFFESLHGGQSGEPKEIKLIEANELVFQWVKKQSDKSYHIAANGDLLYQDETGAVLNTYHPLIR